MVKSINKAWSDNFERMMNEENPRKELRTRKPKPGLTDCMQKEEVAETLRAT